MISQFIDREDELSILREEYSHLPSLVILYGKRRVGKTRLIEEFLKGKKAFIYTFPDSVKEVQLREFKEGASRFFNDEYISKLETDSWYDIFAYLHRIVGNGIAIVLDEFTYAIKADLKITSDLQRAWDALFSRKRILLVLCGSMLGMMNEAVLSSTSPLFGRRSRDILLQPLKPWHSLQFFNDKLYGIEGYMLVGGIPPYLTIASRYRSALNLVEREFLDQNGYFYREPYFLLSQELRETKTYFSIIMAISSGNSTANGIANYVGMETRKIFPYLQQLMSLQLIERTVPFMGPERAGRYFVKDNMLYSWFRLTYRRMGGFISSPRTGIDELSSILGDRFEEVVKEYIINFNLLPFRVEKAGKWWKDKDEIDLIAVNTNEKKVCFIEVRWSSLSHSEALELGKRLQGKATQFEWNKDKRKESYCIVAREIEDKEELTDAGYTCIELKDILKVSSS
ncbi:MAG: ATP-binding protein [Conexivisphaerales archaeon]